MRECENYVDRLPDLLHERLPVAERERVLAHVRGCAECAAEHAWLRTMRDGMVAAGPQVDVAAIARQVQVRLATSQVESPVGAAPTLRLVTVDGDGVAKPVVRRPRPALRSRWASPHLR